MLLQIISLLNLFHLLFQKLSRKHLKMKTKMLIKKTKTNLMKIKIKIPMVNFLKLLIDLHIVFLLRLSYVQRNLIYVNKILKNTFPFYKIKMKLLKLKMMKNPLKTRLKRNL